MFVLIGLAAAAFLAFLASLFVWWSRHKRKPFCDPYPGEDALREYVKSEYEHKPAHSGDQPKPD